VSCDLFYALLLGQIVSLSYAGANVFTNVLAYRYGVKVPAFQIFITYTMLFLAFTMVTFYRVGIRGWFEIFKKRWWLYLIFAAIDVQGYYFKVSSFIFTSIVSGTLLDTWIIPVVVVLSILFLKTRYHWLQFIGVGICIIGMSLLLFSDMKEITSGTDRAKGDIFCIIGATLIGMSNVLEEKSVKMYHVWEVLGQLGLYGMLISGIQVLILERTLVATLSLSPVSIALIVGYNISQFTYYVFVPRLLRMTGATFMNLSLMTSDLYSICFATYYGQTVDSWWPMAYIWIVAGILLYNSKTDKRTTELELTTNGITNGGYAAKDAEAGTYK